MATINDCHLPEDLFYLVDKHVWVRAAAEGPVTVGIDDVAQHLAGPIVSCTPKRAGRSVPQGQSLATIESSKWVGPVPTPVTGEIVEVNEAVRRTPAILNQDPYGEGWLVKLRPANWAGECGGLVTGPQGIETYRALLEGQGIRCRPAAG